jgi:hypothetical protein
VTTTPIWTILDWILYGAVRYVMLWIPLVTPFHVDRSVPWQWFRYNDWGDWSHYNDNNGGPDEHWLNSWFGMCLGELKTLLLEESKPYVDAVRYALSAAIGSVWAAFPNLGSWLQHVQLQIGLSLPHWVESVSQGLDWLRDRLPTEIKFGWSSWDQLWESIKSSVRNWAIARYDQARAWANEHQWWVVNIGESLRTWRDRIAGWIDTVRSDPWSWLLSVLGPGLPWLLEFYRNARAWVISWLGPEWQELVSFRNGPLRFYFDLWARGWASLAQLIDDPRSWLETRLEDLLLDRW